MLVVFKILSFHLLTYRYTQVSWLLVVVIRVSFEYVATAGALRPASSTDQCTY